MDRHLKRLGEALADDDSRRKFLISFRKWSRRLAGGLVAGYAIFLIGIPALFRWVGERNSTIAFLLYLPRIAFLIPIALALPLGLIFHRRAAGLVVVSGLVFLLVGMDLRFRRLDDVSPSTSGSTLNVLTYNRGGHANKSLQPFKNRTHPDLLLMQEAPGRSTGYLRAEGYGEFEHGSDIGEFTILSRYPILSSEPVILEGADPGPPVAAHFVIDFAGTPVSVYTVHTVSPRDTLSYYKRGAFLYGVLGIPGTPLAAKRISNQEYWDQRIQQARKLKNLIAADPLPTIVTGDFNAPAGGYIHGLFRSTFEDAHPRGGSGFGFTFPGSSGNPLSLGGPWMRIDYLFCDEHWRTGWCVTEPDRPSQHRAVAAQFRIRS